MNNKDWKRAVLDILHQVDFSGGYRIYPSGKLCEVKLRGRDGLSSIRIVLGDPKVYSESLHMQIYSKAYGLYGFEAFQRIGLLK